MAVLKNIIKRFQKDKFPFQFVYSDSYCLGDLKNHVFPVEKYRLVYEKLLAIGAEKKNFIEPFVPAEKDLLRVHSSKYIKKIKSGRLSSSELMALELPFSKQAMNFFFLTAGGTIRASEAALRDGLCVHIGGGFHHAFSDHGEGFCVLNDVAIALEKMMAEKKIKKAMVVDCDVHQGNGTAAILKEKKNVFTFSIHQMDIYPAEKASSSLDVGLWSGDGDDEYLAALSLHIPRIYEQHQPDLIYYLAGADPYQKDKLGDLNLTQKGLEQRDQLVIEQAQKRGYPLVILFAGGYALDVRDVVSIHLNTIMEARKNHKRWRKKGVLGILK
ncbi:MAG: histone deacetylase [Candidatus Aminicenantes bacterium]|nr:histone deacetylase [Candidatus Aminicenantes bacterium]